jgi:hypothetical protein
LQEQRAAADAAARARAATLRSQQEQEQRAVPPASSAPSRLEQPAYQSPGHPTDPSAAGRY